MRCVSFTCCLLLTFCLLLFMCLCFVDVLRCWGLDSMALRSLALITINNYDFTEWQTFPFFISVNFMS